MGDVYPLIAVVGPTGSGKSELALRLAAAFGGEEIVPREARESGRRNTRPLMVA